jgi:hypothetical protein
MLGLHCTCIHHAVELLMLHAVVRSDHLAWGEIVVDSELRNAKAGVTKGEEGWDMKGG